MNALRGRVPIRSRMPTSTPTPNSFAGRAKSAYRLTVRLNLPLIVMAIHGANPSTEGPEDSMRSYARLTESYGDTGRTPATPTMNATHVAILRECFELFLFLSKGLVEALDRNQQRSLRIGFERHDGGSVRIQIQASRMDRGIRCGIAGALREAPRGNAAQGPPARPVADARLAPGDER